jgi:peptidoglycan-N-acetylglucosamine deacetylase
VSETGRRVALTFDAEHPDRPLCPPDAFERILDALTERSVRATFFIQGRWAGAYPERPAQVAAAGHGVGNHSHYHARMNLLRDEGIAADVTAAAEVVRATSGRDPKPWFRLPFGEGHEDERVLRAVEALGYRNVHWHVEVEDWEPWRTAVQIEEDVLRGVAEHGDGAVVLLHTWPGPTAEAVPAIVDRLLADGTELVRVDELEELPA